MNAGRRELTCSSIMVLEAIKEINNDVVFISIMSRHAIIKFLVFSFFFLFLYSPSSPYHTITIMCFPFPFIYPTTHLPFLLWDPLTTRENNSFMCGPHHHITKIITLWCFFFFGGGGVGRSGSSVAYIFFLEKIQPLLVCFEMPAFVF